MNWWASKNYTTGLRPREKGKNHTTAPSARGKCTPSAYGTAPRESGSRNFQSPYGSLQISFDCHPGGGGFSGAMLCDAYEIKAERRADFPPTGEVVAPATDRGAFPLGEARFACFPTPDRAVLKVLS